MTNSPNTKTFSVTWLKRNRDLVSLFTFVTLLILIPSLTVPAFRSKNNYINIFNQIAPISFVSMGQTFVILTTGIDLSVGSVMSLTTAIASSPLNTGSLLGAVLIVGIVILVALIIGFINGIIITKLNLEPLIATLAVGTIIRGITLIILPYPGGYSPPLFTGLWLYKIAGIVPLAFVYFILAGFIAYVLLHYTVLGRRIYAVGGNETRSRIAGINTDRIKIKAYMLCSLFAALSGLSLTARMRSGDPLAGEPFTLLSVAAVLVGGTTFAGGRGGVLGTIAGIFILGLLSIILNIFGISPFFKDVLTGIIVVIAVVYTSINK